MTWADPELLWLLAVLPAAIAARMLGSAPHRNVAELYGIDLAPLARP